jgi:MFS family permease
MAAILTYIAVNKESYIWLIVALAFWGAFWGTADTSLSALFADSVPKGQRSYYFTLRSSLIMAGNLAGPAAALILFALLGDKWTVRDCAIVVAVGNTLSLPALLVLWFMKDEQTEQENLSDQLDGTEPLLVNNGPPSDYNDDEGTTEQSRGLLGIPENRVVPILISAADILSGLGSGMSIRYFPIFFMDNLKLSPAMVQVLYILSPVLQTLLMHVGQLWSQSFGRCRVTVMYKWVGILCMFTMLLSYHFGVSVWVTCTLYILRTSFMNSTSALTKSVLMDSVPRSERGKWSALESVNMFSWSGSAALGGILVSIEGIMFNFCVTASIQLLATFPLVALFSRDKAEGANDSPSRGHVQGIDEECDSETAASSSSYDAYVERI